MPFAPEIQAERHFQTPAGLVEPVPGMAAYLLALPMSNETQSYFAPSDTVRVVEQENRFASKVIEAALDLAARHPGTITVLADVDETIAEGSTLIRPAFPFALNQLQEILGDRIEAGLLTTNSQDVIEERASIYFEGVKARVNPGFIISSGTYERERPELRKLLGTNDVETKMKMVDEIIDPEIIRATLAGEYSDRWFDPKLVVLQATVQANRGRAFLYIDDYAYPAILRKDHPQLSGVWVAGEMQNGRPRPSLDQVFAK